MSESRSVPPLRIAVLGDFEGMHTRRWLEVFVRRGHDVHAISFYRPRAQLPGVKLHVLRHVEAPSATGPSQPGGGFGLRRFIPPSLMRLIQARRYSQAGLGKVLRDIQPDVFHAHFAVEYGFYGAFAGFHPYVISAWGSDLLVESHKTFGRLIARRALGRADLVTANDASLAARAIALGVPEDRVDVVHLGIDSEFLEAGERTVNLQSETASPPTVISVRALEPLYNVDVVLEAFARVREGLPAVRLIVAGEGSREGALRELADRLQLGDLVEFVGQVDAARLASLLASAHVYVSVPSSDSLALSTVEAMAAGCFPVVADLSSVHGWITDGINGYVVPAGETDSLAAAMRRALEDGELRRSAVQPNRDKVAAEGLRERNMLLMERHYYRLAGHPQAGSGEAI